MGLLREYFILCGQNNSIQSVKGTVSKKKTNRNPKAFSYDGIVQKLKTLCPGLTFNIQTLRKPGSFNAKSLVFHGTDKKNINSIIQKGLVIGGKKGVSISNGSLYGHGIYCSPNLQTASCYSNGAIFVCSASNANKFGNIWVVPKENGIVCCYLIRYNGGYLSNASVANSTSNPTMQSNDIALFIPALGKLNAPKKFRNHQRRFSNRFKSHKLQKLIFF